MRLIDGDALIKALIRKEPFSDCARVVIAECIEEVRHAPTIEERKTGKWILCDEQRKEDTDNGNYRYLCSNCNYADIHAKNIKVPFCWHCGAKMEGEQP